MANRLSLFAFFAASILVAVFFHTYFANIPDADSLYHIRHAWLYRTTSPLATEFPWTYYSSIRTEGGDLWYGFHLLLIPFTFFSDMTIGIVAAGIVLTVFLLCIFAWIAYRHRMTQWYFWPFFLFFAIPNVLFYFLMVRPHILSLGLGLLLISFFARKQRIGVFAASAGITFFHISYFWFGLGLSLAWLAASLLLIFVFKTLLRDELNAHISLAGISIIGTTAGAFLRPEPWAAIRLTYIQDILLFFQKQADIPLVFGTELYPLPIVSIFTTALVFTAIWAGALGVSARAFSRQSRLFRAFSAENQILFLLLGALSLFFFVLTIAVAIRFFIAWVAFGALFIAFIASFVLTRQERNAVALALPLLFLILVPYALYRHSLNERYVATPPERLKDAALWLSQNSSPGDIVFPLHWDNFASLFFYNQKNYYIGGMDPIFQFSYNPELYWKFHYLSIDEVSDYTCKTFPCTEEGLVDTYETLTSDFRARYVLVEPARNPNMLAYLLSDSRYDPVFQSAEASIFLVK